MKRWVIKYNGRYVSDNNDPNWRSMVKDITKAFLYPTKSDAEARCDKEFGEKVVPVKMIVKELR